jgi:cytochrome c oxidase subunit IV
MEQAEMQGRVISHRTFIRVWLVLLLLTAILVLTSRFFHETLSVPALLIVTPIKAGLVFFYFMHLKHERPFLKGLVFMTLGLLVIVIGLLFSDLFYR